MIMNTSQKRVSSCLAKAKKIFGMVAEKNWSPAISIRLQRGKKKVQ